MKIISHRGNLNGPNPELENKPETILKALSFGFDVEIDIHVVDGQIYLGHDNPQYLIDLSFLQNNRLWIHCKNKNALELMSRVEGVHYFWHQSDTYTLTSKGIIWTYTGADLIPGSICVLPKSGQNISDCRGVCTDFPFLHKGNLQ